MIHDLRYLWRTRHSSGFPWPFRWSGFHGRTRLYALLTGRPPWTVIPLWKQLLTIPLRPWRYAKMVRGIARARAVHYHPSMQDDVP